MSYTISPEDRSWETPPEQQSSYSRRLLSVVAGAVLFVLGVVIGGFMTRSPIPSHVEPHRDEIAALRAKVEMLTVQSAEYKVRSTELEQLLKSQQGQFTQERETARLAQQRAMLLRLAMETNQANRELCLSELQSLHGHPYGVPTTQVVRFVEAIFDNQTETLDILASEDPMPPSLPAFVSSLDVVSRSTNQDSAALVQTTAPQPTPAEPTPTLAEPTVANASRPSVFFSAPPRRTQGVTFITPKGPSRVASRQNSGMKFIDDTDQESGPILR